MAKRIADKELTDRNWDQEDEGEECSDGVHQAGTFSIASDDVMKSRPIKKAKRRAAGSEGQSGGAVKVFKGFSLAPTSGTGPAAEGITAFSGFGNGVGFKPLSGLSNGNSGKPVTPALTGFTSPTATKTTTPGSLTFSGPSSSAVITGQQSNGSSPAVSSRSLSSSLSSNSGNNQEYSRQLTALNCSVRDWITKHVNGNPLCDLNPIFRDYEKHLASIDKKYGGSGGTGAVTGVAVVADGGSESSSRAEEPEEKRAVSTPPPPSSSAAGSTATVPVFSFSKDKDGSATAPGDSSAAPIPAGISFSLGQKGNSSVLGSLSTGGAPSVSSSSLFGGAAPPAFSFSGAKAEAAPTQTTDGNGEESDEPPKVEVQEIKETDAFYSKKCKLFYKKETEFKEKGVGTLHLKTTSDGKTQLLVRADTNLGNILLNILVQPSSITPPSPPGNILLNILVQPSILCSRMGKNNVMVMCVPNPVVDHNNPTNPVAMLIRVKTAEDADELHNILEEKKA
ncbi:nuclear pore complex protein Nup50 isoform X1 [Oncorhynchus tshawytscha]|uniref:nuclear pore complex protein Nup50 isoform X1 n=1 Tax=Oncorhynchus tshawytscha TaxID=74940 RepID=UPI001C3D0503|nr:nuclear pore complex protein Nup50 isoform X1 [Oncorhynchus tshawytscha]